MKILCYSDLHGNIPVLPSDIVAPIILAGDIFPDPPEEYSWLCEEDAIDLHIKMYNFLSNAYREYDVYSVRGNHDIRDSYNSLDRFTTRLNNTTAHLRDNIWLVGLEWVGKHYWNLPYESDLAPICDHITEIVLSRPTRHIILVTHYPPVMKALEGVVFGYEGHVVIRELIDKIKPLAVVCGHIHQIEGTTEKMELRDGGHTTVYLTGYNGMIIDTDALLKETV